MGNYWCSRVCWLACVALSIAMLGAAHAAGKPNVVVILADDAGWGDWSVSGNTNLKTPNVDSLARDGASFSRFFVQPVCSPTRAEFLTGRYHPRGGVWNVSLGGERLNLDERTIADVFRAAGYATGCFGKWHNGTQYPYHPRGRGFDEFYGYTSGHWGDYFSPPLDHNGQIVQGDGFLADDLTEHAMKFIESNHAAGRPFFCYLPLPTPHTPAQVPDPFFAKFAGADLKLRADGKGEDVAKTRAVMAMCENIDFNVGRVLDRLRELKLADDTIVVFFSDNGPNGARWNGGMRGIKGSTDDGGTRSTLHVRWPGQVKAGRVVPDLAGAIDLMPTLADLAGVPVAEGKPLDGMSLKPLLTSDAPPKGWPVRILFNHWMGKVSARAQDFRLDSEGHLYDMAADPGQRRDVSAGHPDVAAALKAAVAKYRAEVLSELKRGKEDDRPLTVGHPEFPATQLEARDGEPHGNIRRSASAPNCSFFTNWSDKSDQITWDIDIATAGRYEASVYYTCPPSSVGSRIELSLNDIRTVGTITAANDPPLHGMEHDRIPRDAESYVKDFRPLNLGTLDLKSGRGTLTLSALEMPGKQAMDVRMVVLTLAAPR
jgi:arylsulfatase A-like enzyme